MAKRKNFHPIVIYDYVDSIGFIGNLINKNTAIEIHNEVYST